MKQITGDFIKSNCISAEKYISENHLESYFQTKTRSSVSACIDYRFRCKKVMKGIYFLNLTVFTN